MYHINLNGTYPSSVETQTIDLSGMRFPLEKRYVFSSTKSLSINPFYIILRN